MKLLRVNETTSVNLELATHVVMDDGVITLVFQGRSDEDETAGVFTGYWSSDSDDWYLIITDDKPTYTSVMSWLESQHLG